MRIVCALALGLGVLACAQSHFGGGSSLDGGANACESEQRSCDDSGNVLVCSKGGTWESIGACSDGRTCVKGECELPKVCPKPGIRQCQGDELLECNSDQTAWELVEQCDAEETCTGGACIGLCDIAAADHSFVACEFWTYSLDNPELSSDNYELIAANPNNTAAIITVEARSGDSWAPVTSFTVGANLNNYINLQPRNAQDTAIAGGAAYRVTASLPVTMYQLNAYPWLGIGGTSSGASLLYPTSALGRRHYTVTLSQGNGGGFFGDGDVVRAYLVVVAVEDETNVFVRVGETGTIVAGEGVPNDIVAGQSHRFVLNAGDVLQLASKSPSDDLTGTFVDSDKPVAFFSGHENGSPAANTSAVLDHYEEQIPSVDKWGTEFVGAKIVPTENPAAAPVWRIVASEDDTLLEFEAGAGTTGLPATAPLLNDGEWFEAHVNGHFHLQSRAASGDPDDKKPILVAQFVTADTDMVIVPPVQQYLPSYVFTNFAGGEVTGTITVARPVGASVLLDGVPWTATFTDAGAGWEVAQATNPVGNHVITVGTSPDAGNALQVWIRGNGGGCTFSYVAGFNFRTINPIE